MLIVSKMHLESRRGTTYMASLSITMKFLKLLFDPFFSVWSKFALVKGTVVIGYFRASERSVFVPSTAPKVCLSSLTTENVFGFAISLLHPVGSWIFLIGSKKLFFPSASPSRTNTCYAFSRIIHLIRFTLGISR